MSVEIFFAGSGAASPFSRNELPGFIIRYKGSLYIFDCGEGFQKKFSRFKLGFNKPMYLFISHLHGDHYLGIRPFLQTLSLSQRSLPVFIYGPPGLSEYIFSYILKDKLGFRVYIKEFWEEKIIRINNDVRISFVRAVHTSTAFSFIWTQIKRKRFDVKKAEALGIPPGPLRRKLVRGETIVLNNRVIKPDDVLLDNLKPIKVVYSGDTMPNYRLASKARDADILIHESTYSTEDYLKAYDTLHSTAKDAAQIAKKTKTSLLVLFHYSNRYENIRILEQEAKKYFSRVILSKPGLKITISGGNPRLFVIEELF